MVRPMKLALAAIALPLAALWSVAAPAASNPAKLDDKALLAWLDKSVKADTPPCELIPALDEAEKRSLALRKYFGTFVRGHCALVSDRPAEALALYTQLETSGLGKGSPERVGAIESLALHAAVGAKDKPAIATHLLHVAERDNPTEFARLDERFFGHAFWQADKPDRGRIALRFVRGHYFHTLPDTLQNAFNGQAILPAAEAGDAALAARLIAETDSPRFFADALVDREWSKVWPLLEARAGPGLNAVMADDVRKASARAAAKPEDWELLFAQVSALELARRYDDVVARSDRVDRSAKGLKAIGEYQGWILNSRVHALDWLGRRAEGDALFDAMAKLDPKERDWLVNFVINRADRLAMQGRWQEAEPAARLAREVASTHGSAYAKYVSLSVLACAVHKLRPSEDIAAWRGEIERNWQDNVGSAIDFALCRDELAAAKDLLLRGLENSETRDTVVRRLQPKGADINPDPFDGALSLPESLRTDPEVRAAFDRYARVLPEQFWPRPLPPGAEAAQPAG